MIALSPRLETIAKLIPEGLRVADIGTDHAYLPAALILSGRADFVIACDIGEKPLQNARHTVDTLNLADKIDLRLSNGLEKVSPNEVDAVVIAGMGGEVIAGIIENAKWLKEGKLLLLQPMSSPEILRKFLCQNGYELKSETAISDNSKIYTVMSVSGGQAEKKSEEFYVSGLLDPKDTLSAEYLRKQLRRFAECAEDIKDIEALSGRYADCMKIVEHLRNLLEGN